MEDKMRHVGHRKQQRQKRALTGIAPGEILLEEFLRPHGLAPAQVEKELAWPPGQMAALINGGQVIDEMIAQALGQYFGIDSQFWINLQDEFERRVAAAAGKFAEAPSKRD